MKILEKIFWMTNHCTHVFFAVEAERRGMARYLFINSVANSEDLLKLRDGLYDYVKNYKSIGKRTTLVIFFKPSEELLSAEKYKKQFWKVNFYMKTILNRGQRTFPLSLNIHNGSFALGENRCSWLQDLQYIHHGEVDIHPTGLKLPSNLEEPSKMADKKLGTS